jgi:adenine phosphoribosyltransferase
MDLRNGFDISRYIRNIPDYPKPGIMFRDITTLLSNQHAFRAAIDELAWPFLHGQFEYVAGIEARGFILGGAVAHTLGRGFILGGAVAHTLGRGFIPIRKKGKLPARVIGQEYTLEYGVDTIEIHADAINKGDRILLIDDLIATGGTAGAAIDLIRKSGGEVLAAAFVIDLPDLGGADKLRAKGVKTHTLVSYAGH